MIEVKPRVRTALLTRLLGQMPILNCGTTAGGCRNGHTGILNAAGTHTPAQNNCAGKCGKRRKHPCRPTQSYAAPGESAALLEIAMAWRGETENGLGWGGLVPSKAEQRAEARQASLEKDAQRYRKLRRGQHWSVVNGIGDTLRGDELDAAVDAVPAVGAA